MIRFYTPNDGFLPRRHTFSATKLANYTTLCSPCFLKLSYVCANIKITKRYTVLVYELAAKHMKHKVGLKN